METNRMLTDLDRAAASPFISYPVTPSWYPALMGAFFAGCAAAYFLGSAGHTVWALVVLAAMLSMAGGFFGWYRRRWGTWPNVAEAPAEIRTAYLRFLAGIGAAVVVSVAGCALLGPWVATLTVFAIFTAWIWWYERRIYPAACEQVRERLA